MSYLKNTKSKRSINSLPAEVREHVAENMKERIYSAITLMAIVTTLWSNAAHHSHRGAIGAIVGSVVALWLATLVSTRISHRAVHGKGMTLPEYRSTLFATSGLLAPAIMPVILILFSATGIIELSTALAASMIVLLGSMLYFSFVASLKIYDSYGKILLVSLVELVIGLMVIALKLALGE